MDERIEFSISKKNANPTSLIISEVYEPVFSIGLGQVEHIPDFQQHPVAAHNL